MSAAIYSWAFAQFAVRFSSEIGTLIKGNIMREISYNKSEDCSNYYRENACLLCINNYS